MTVSINRFLPFAMILAVALTAIAVGTLMYQARMRTPAAPAPNARTTAAASASAATSTASEEEGPDAEHVRGAADAPVTLEIFGDFQCPSCAMVSSVIGRLEHDYGERLRVVFREFPLAIHSHAIDAALAAEAAGLQGRFWEMHDLLYQSQDAWSKASDAKRFFELYARSLGLDVERFRSDCQSEALRARIIAQGELGVSRGVENTPTIFVNGTMLRGAFTRDNLRTAIDGALAGKKS